VDRPRTRICFYAINNIMNTPTFHKPAETRGSFLKRTKNTALANALALNKFRNEEEAHGSGGSSYGSGCSVGAAPIPRGAGFNAISDSDLCLNAQPEYKKARWRIAVWPRGTASVSVKSGQVVVSGGGGLSNGDEFEVTAIGIGAYELEISHDSLNCKSTAGGNAFRLEFKHISLTGSNIIDEKPIKWTEFEKSSDTDFYSLVALSLSGTSNLASDQVSQTAVWKFKLVTQPEGAFGGVVKSSTLLTAKFAYDMTAWGAASLKLSAGVASASMTFSDVLTLEGLEGDAPNIDAKTASANGPQLIVLGSDHEDGEGENIINAPDALYRVDKTITAKDELSLVVQRKGTVLALGGGHGGAAKSGFYFTPGLFELQPVEKP
jgi:hypothetical protein